MKHIPPRDLEKLNYYLYGPNETILDAVTRQLANEKKGRVLDIGAGSGLLCEKLGDLGFRVFACDVTHKDFKLKKVPFKIADVSKKLPYTSGSFDYVTCTEVVEHIENPWIFAREISRILKPNGKLVMTWPNFTSLISRLVFLTRGNFRYFDDWTWDNWGHINPITFTEVYKIMREQKLTCVAFTTQERMGVASGLFLRGVQKTLNLLLHTFKMTSWNKDPFDKTYPLLEKPALLYGENIVATFQKRTG